MSIEITNDIETVPFDYTTFEYRHEYKNVRRHLQNGEDILISASNVTWNRHIVPYWFICATVKLYFAPEEVTWHCNEKVYAAARFVTPRATPDRYASCVTPQTLCPDFDELFLFFIYLFFSLVGKGREGKTDNSRCIAFEKRSGERRKGRGGRKEGLFGK